MTQESKEKSTINNISKTIVNFPIKKLPKINRTKLSFKKIANLLETAETIRNTPAIEDNALAFMARALVQATLPHSDPGSVSAWGRDNGSYSLSIEPGYIIKDKQPKSIGLPYGTIPRLLMFWITTEALRTKKPELTLGSSLAGFMKRIGLDPSTGGGCRGDAARLREQMKRLFSAHISFTWADDEKFLRNHYTIAEKIRLWWNPKDLQQENLFDSSIVLSQKFFEEIVERPVPVDMRALAELKQSPLALDLYAWLTYRVSYLKKSQLVTWPQLHEQFGADFTDIRAFRFKVRQYLARIFVLYQELRVEDDKGGLVLFPSPSHVSPRALQS